MRDHPERAPGLQANSRFNHESERLYFQYRSKDSDAFWSTAAQTAMGTRLAGLSADYSLGASRSTLRQDLFVLTDMSLRAWSIAQKTMAAREFAGLYKFGRDAGMYRKWLWLLSLAIALEVEDSVFDDVVAALEPVWADRLIGLLIQSRRPDFQVGEDFAFKTLGRGLAKAWDAPNPVKALESYLAKWPSYYKREGWIDSVQYAHNEGDMRYFGLWAFETTGVVKALNLDDTRLLSNEYYPAGILHADR